jgi:hypothetical protein
VTARRLPWLLLWLPYVLLQCSIGLPVASAAAGPNSTRPATPIAGGHSHFCANFLDGKVKCWGAQTPARHD